MHLNCTTDQNTKNITDTPFNNCLRPLTYYRDHCYARRAARWVATDSRRPSVSIGSDRESPARTSSVILITKPSIKSTREAGNNTRLELHHPAPLHILILFCVQVSVQVSVQVGVWVSVWVSVRWSCGWVCWWTCRWACVNEGILMYMPNVLTHQQKHLCYKLPRADGRWQN
jgi:hypothetical protein